MKIPGIIGGLGPETTADFYLQIQQLAIENNLKSRPFMMIGSVNVPYELEKRIFLDGGDITENLPLLVNTIKKLQNSGIDFLVMPCNTLHILVGNLTQEMTVPFINIVDETIKEIQNQGYKKVTLLSTDTLAKSNLYQSAFAKNNIQYQIPNETDQQHLDILISRLVNSQQTIEDRKFFNNFLRTLQSETDAIILACTDFHILVDKQTDYKVIDTMAVLAHATFNKIIE